MRTLFFFLFSSVLTTIVLSENSLNWQCTSSETALDLKPCVPIHTRMQHLMEEYFEFKSKEMLKEISEVCEKVKTCLATKKCVNLARVGDYIDLCDSFEFHVEQVPQCINKFYTAASNGSVQCLRVFDFFGNKLIDSLTRGKSCFLRTLNSTCTPQQYKFISDNYEEFLKLMKTDNGRGACRGLKHTITRSQCTPIFAELRDIDTTTDHLEENKDDQKNAAKICERGMKCLKNTCSDIETYFSTDSFSKMECVIIKKGNTDNWKCFEKSADYDNHPCGKEVNNLYNDQSIPSCIIKQKQADCLRVILKEKCPGAKEQDYQDYNFVLNNDNDCPGLKF